MGRVLQFLSFSLLISCIATAPREGVKGQVFWVSGNQMPGPDNSRSSHYGVQREIFVYALTTLKDVSKTDDGFFTEIKTELITSLTTKADGSFRVKLPPGTYSLLVKEEKGLYANAFDENNAINPVVVKEKQYTWLPITVDYEAVY